MANVLAREMQLNLRKRKVDFSRTGEALKIIEERKRMRTSETDNVVPQKSELSDLNNQGCKVEIKNGNTEQLKKPEPDETQSDAAESKDICHKLSANIVKTYGCVTNEDVVKLRVEEKKKIDFANKLYLAPLTTVSQSKDFWASFCCHT